MSGKQDEIDVTIPVFIIPIVGRSLPYVFSDITEEELKKIRYPPIETVLEDKTPGFVDHEKKPNILYRYYLWNKVKDNINNFKDYFTGLCNSVCTSENKTSIVNHFSLWEAYNIVNINDKEDKFIMVVEDSNTVLNINDITEIIKSMYEKNIDILQLREILYNGNTRKLLNKDGDTTMYTYNGGYDFSLSAYIIRISKMKELITAIMNMGGVSTSLSFEMYRLENELKINRQVLNDANKFVKSDKRELSNMRLDNMKSGIWNRLGSWTADRFPDFYYFISQPLFSFFGIFDVTILGVIIILIITIILIFNVNSNLIWFLCGILFTYII
ncbi:MV heparin binding surface protein [Brazilian porcupinepox virus 1]|nr:MV heparin binding surface protein [Brazilian porcupinepox virus 1]